MLRIVQNVQRAAQPTGRELRCGAGASTAVGVTGVVKGTSGVGVHGFVGQSPSLTLHDSAGMPAYNDATGDGNPRIGDVRERAGSPSPPTSRPRTGEREAYSLNC